MRANNEVGTLQPIAEIARIAREHEIPMHTDAAQAVGKMPTDVDKLGVDLLTVVGHKMGAPKGIGALYVRPGTHLDPLIHGGGHERGLRAGTENVPYIAGLGAACALAARRLANGADAEVRALRDRLNAALLAAVPELELNGHRELRLPNTLNVSFPGRDGERLLATIPRSRRGDRLRLPLRPHRALACSDRDGNRSGARARRCPPHPRLRHHADRDRRSRGSARRRGRGRSRQDPGVIAEAYDRRTGRYGAEPAAVFTRFVGIEPGMRVLDLGCGTGALTMPLVQIVSANRVAAVDPSQDYADACRRRVPGAAIRMGSADALPFDDGDFDDAWFSIAAGAGFSGKYCRSLDDRRRAAMHEEFRRRLAAPGGSFLLEARASAVRGDD